MTCSFDARHRQYARIISFPPFPDRARPRARSRAPRTRARPPHARLRQNARENRDCQRLARTHVVRARRDAFRGPTPRVRVHGVTTAIARRLARRRRASASSRRSRARPHRTPSDARRARRLGHRLDRSIDRPARIDRSIDRSSRVDRSVDRDSIAISSRSRATTWGLAVVRTFELDEC